jgi:hypothetical protein
MYFEILKRSNSDCYVICDLCKALFAKWKMSDRILIESDNTKSNLSKCIAIDLFYSLFTNDSLNADIHHYKLFYIISAARPVTNLPLNTNASIRRSFQQLPKEGADKSTKVEEIVTSGVEDTTVRHPASLNNAPHTTGIRAKADPEVEERENKSHQEGEAGARTGAAAAGLHDDSRLRHPRPLTPGTRRALQRTVSLQHLPSLRHTGQHSDKHSSLQVDTTHARLRPVHNTMQPDCF